MPGSTKSGGKAERQAAEAAHRAQVRQRELAEIDVLASMRSTLRALEDLEILAELGRSDALTVRDLTAIARAKRELSTGIRAEIDAQESRARALPPAEQALVLAEAVLALPIAQQIEVLRRLRVEASPQVLAESATDELETLQ